MLTAEDVTRMQIELVEERIRLAEREMYRRLQEDIYLVRDLPATNPKPIPWTTRMRWRWYAVREWIAVHVLRIDVGSEEE